MSGLRKAQVALVVMLLLAVAIFVGMVIARGINYLRGAAIKSELEIKLLINDRGRELLALLSSKTTDVSNNEIIGNIFSKGYDERKLSVLEDTLDRMGRGAARYVVILNGTGSLVKLIKPPEKRTEENELEAKIPVPGGAKGPIKGYVRIG